MSILFSNCPVCNSNNTSSIKVFKNYPAILFPVTRQVSKTISTKDLSIKLCENCLHQYQTSIELDFNSKIYIEYYKFYPYHNIECFIDIYRKPFEKLFLSLDVNKKKKLLEIGVSNGSQLEFFDDLGFDSYGITPQEVGDCSKIFSGFYEEYCFKDKFDLIVSRFNLEHIIDLDNFFGKINKDLNDNGLLCVQVPNIEYFMENNILNFYAHEHIHYFNANSLSLIFQKHGFIIENIENVNSPSIIVCGRKNSAIKNKTFGYFSYAKDINDKIYRALEDFNITKGKIFFYGAGLSLTQILYDMDVLEKFINKIVIIDDNPLVSGMVMPFFDNISIVPYNKGLIDEEDIIVLTLNPIYHNTVIEKLRGDKLFNKVYLINSNGFVEA